VQSQIPHQLNLFFFKKLILYSLVQLHTLFPNDSINTDTSEKLTLYSCFQQFADENMTYVYFVHDSTTAHMTNWSVLLLKKMFDIESISGL